MQEINLKTLNLKKLNQIQDKQNREGSIYHDEKIAFKICKSSWFFNFTK